MRKRINAYFLVVTFVAIVMTVILATIADYEIFKKERIDDLRNYVHLLKNSGVFNDPDNVQYTADADNIRISFISEDGMVCYDNQANVDNMEEHGDRPEVKAALKKGEGSAIRESETLGENTYYYAEKLDNGYVVRVAKEADSIWHVFTEILPLIGVITVIMLALTVVLTSFLTRSIIKPIEQVANNLDNVEGVTIYKELKPFVTKIKMQHEDIMQSAQMRQTFTANVSHELKTPLTVISGYSELIENGMAAQDDIPRFAANIHKNSARLLTLINDIIHLSELDVMETKPEMEQVDIFDLVKTAAEMLQMNAEKHNVTLIVTGVPAVVMANRGMMDELVYNLIDNAIRYNKENGSVRVHVYTDGNIVELSVKDTGIGISKDNIERIFERFYRVDKSRSKSTGGTGLGLAIVKHIVLLHEGKIETDSETGVGTTMTVTMKAVV